MYYAIMLLLVSVVFWMGNVSVVMALFPSFNIAVVVTTAFTTFIAFTSAVSQLPELHQVTILALSVFLVPIAIINWVARRPVL